MEYIFAYATACPQNLFNLTIFYTDAIYILLTTRMSFSSLFVFLSGLVIFERR
ncbi:protein of unknown function [Cardinium endosymbiont cEper1 of Encarsia pergandiella]|nr:protein of unknown function [Cardinium endosymbiont cEper1 of Encarsia pergandiella]